MFREKYKADNELIKAPEKISREVYDMKPNTIRYARIAMVAACVLVAVAAIFMLPGRLSQSPVRTDVGPGGQQVIKLCRQVHKQTESQHHAENGAEHHHQRH